MKSDHTISLIFPNSRSKNYTKALRSALMFSNFRQGDINILNANINEVFQKWEYFNRLFWLVVDWKGSIIEFKGHAFEEHTDKTRIFYAIQDSRYDNINSVVDRIHEIRNSYNCTTISKLNALKILN